MNASSRRNALKALAVGVPAVWAKPVVETVILPAHAILSGFTSSDSISGLGQNIGSSADCDNYELLVSNASPSDRIAVAVNCLGGTLDPSFELISPAPDNTVYSDNDSGAPCNAGNSSLINSVQAVNGSWDLTVCGENGTTGDYEVVAYATGNAIVELDP